jgi:hypothetical protein
MLGERNGSAASAGVSRAPTIVEAKRIVLAGRSPYVTSSSGLQLAPDYDVLTWRATPFTQFLSVPASVGVDETSEISGRRSTLGAS